VVALKLKLGVTQFEKTRIAFALSFLKEEAGCTLTDGRAERSYDFIRAVRQHQSLL